jgi:hypothetical protein
MALLAATIQATRWVSVSARQAAATRPMVSRTANCDGVRGLVTRPAARLICPNGLFCETFRPRLPD